MTRFYLRVLLLMLLTFVVSIVLILSGLGGLERIYFRPNFATEMQALAKGLQARLEEVPGDRAVHRAGVQEGVAQLDGQPPRDGALPGSGRTVDRDDLGRVRRGGFVRGSQRSR